MIEQFNYQTGEIAAGYRGESAKWCIYYISDLEKIKKLIGEEAAKELDPIPIQFDAGRTNKPEFSVYSFIFIPKSEILGDLVKSIQSAQLNESFDFDNVDVVKHASEDVKNTAPIIVRNSI